MRATSAKPMTGNGRGRQPADMPEAGMGPGDYGDFRGSDVAGLSNTAEETLSALREARNLAEQIDGRLFGDYPAAACKGEGLLPPPGVPPLAAQVEEGCAVAAGLAKRLRAILDRL